MLRSPTFGVLTILLAAATSQAALIPTYTIVKDPSAGTNFGAPEATLGAPWIGVQLSIVATAGEQVGAVDVAFTGNKLHQRWTDGDFDGVTDPTFNGAASDGRGDSHLVAPAGSPFGAGPAETNTKAGSPLTSTAGATEYGVGDLSGAWALLNPAATTNLAYIVFKSGDAPNIGITVKSANPAGVNNPVILTADFGGIFAGPSIPEPATVTMLGLALVGGLGFRRRNA